MQTGQKVFALRSSEIIVVEFVKYSKRGTAAFLKKVGEDKEILISLSKLFHTEEEANAELNSLLNYKKRKAEKQQQEQERLAKEREEISAICWKIYCEFDIEIPFLSQPHNIEDAKKLYRQLKRERQSVEL